MRIMEYRRIASICGVVLSVVVLVSCADNKAVRLRYEAEKKFHQAQKLLTDARIKPELTDPLTMKGIATTFGEVLEFCYQTLDSIDATSSPVEHREVQHLIFQSSSRLSQLFFSYKRYDTCAAILNRLLDRVQLDEPLLLTSYINLGQALQSNGAWDSALAVYDNALQRYYPPIDDSGKVMLPLFNIPRHIFGVVNMIGDSAEAADQFTQAEQYYRRLSDSFPDTRLATASHANLARLYNDTRRWEDEIAELSALVDTASPRNLAVELRIADTYGTKIKNLDHALKLYNEILDSLKKTDTLTRSLVFFKICMVKMEQGEYAQAREILVDLKEDCPRFYAARPMAQYAMARSFELEGNWKRAEIEYKYLIENYRSSDEAMATYMYLADLFEKQGRHQESEKWFKEAEQHFDEIATFGEGTIVEARALTYKADLYRQNKDFDRSAKTLLKLFDKYPDSKVGRQALLKASAMYRKYLHNEAAADSLIEVLKATVTHIEEEWES